MQNGHKLHGLPGTLTVLDGTDFSGKGTSIQSIVKDLEKRGLRVFDIEREFWMRHHMHPDFDNPTLKGKTNPFYVNPDDYDVFVMCEPTWAGIGRIIREEMIQDNGRPYSARATMQAYALDRLTLITRVEQPLLARGKHVIKGRSVSTSICYQPLQASMQGETSLGLDELFAEEGNSLAMHNCPDVLMLMSGYDAAEIARRKEERKHKQDNAIFENSLEFQGDALSVFMSDGYRDIFRKPGTKVVDLYSGEDEAKTRSNAVELYSAHVLSLLDEKFKRA